MNDAAAIENRYGRGSVPILSEGAVKPLMNKWTPLLKGLEQPGRRRIVAMLLENQARYFNDIMTEEVRSTVVGPFLKFVFPMIRRTWAEVIAPELVSVQPMTAPIGGIAFYRPRYGSTKGGITAGDEAIVNFDFDYTSERVNGQLLGSGDASTLVFTGTTKKPVRPATLKVFVGTRQVASADSAGNIVDFGAGDIQTGLINTVTGQIQVVFNAGFAPASGTSVLLNYEYDMEANPDVPEFRFDIQITEIRAKPRKLKVLWSAEAEEDLRALWGTDITTELVGASSAEMSLETDREIINDLLGAALSGTNKKTFDAKAPAAVSLSEHLKGIVVPISQVSNLIHKKTLRGPANWIVTSPEVAAILDATPYFTQAGPSAWGYQGGIQKVGTLQGKWVVYVDPYFQRDLMLVGRQGGSMLDTGYVFAPYVPLQVTGTFMDPGDFTLRKGLRTRYAKLLVRPEFYGLVQVLNI